MATPEEQAEWLQRITLDGYGERFIECADLIRSQQSKLGPLQTHYDNAPPDYVKRLVLRVEEEERKRKAAECRLDSVTKHLTEKNNELHRRCQLAEGAVLRKMKGEQAGGAPLAKRLAIAGYAAEQERAEKLQGQIAHLLDNFDRIVAQYGRHGQPVYLCEWVEWVRGVEKHKRICGAPLSSSRTKNCLLPDGHAGDHQFSTVPE